MTEEILELGSYDPDRPKARIRTPEDPEGTIYEIAVPDDFGAVELRRLARLFAKGEELFQQEKELTPAQGRQLEQTIDALASLLIRDAPEEVISAVSAMQKRELALRFFGPLGERIMEAMGERGREMLASLSAS